MLRTLKGFGQVLYQHPAMVHGRIHTFRRNNYIMTIKKPRRFIYGVVYIIDGSEEVMKCLDGYYGCSKTYLKENKPSDLHHRTEVEIIPIVPLSIKDFMELNFKTLPSLTGEYYLLNINADGLEASLRNEHKYKAKYTSNLLHIINEQNY